MKQTRALLMACLSMGLCMAAEPGAAGGGEPPAPKGKQPKLVEARVLVDCEHGKVDDIVTVTEDVAANAPELDDHPSAVSYAKKSNAAKKAREAAARGEVVE